jgi:hypothetical protein
MMNNLRSRRTSNSHDHIYALYGVIEMMYREAPPPVDYARPLDLVYRDFFAYITTSRPFFLHRIADSGIHQAIHGGPSWLSDWSKPSGSRTWLEPRYLAVAGTDVLRRVVKGQYLNTSEGEVEIVCVVDGRVLKVSAAFHCRLAFCSTVEEQSWHDSVSAFFADDALPGDRTCNLQLSKEASRQSSVLKLLYDWVETTLSMENSEDIFRKVVMTLFTYATTDIGRNIRPEYLNAKFELVSCIRTAVKHYRSFEGAHRDVVAVASIVHAAKDMPYLGGVLEEIFQSMTDRSVFTTKDGDVGLGPQSMEVGDRIAFIAGVGLPMVLRPHQPVCEGESCYYVVGPILFPPLSATHSTSHWDSRVDWASRETISLI